jgi:hypothetical protein
VVFYFGKIIKWFFILEKNFKWFFILEKKLCGFFIWNQRIGVSNSCCNSQIIISTFKVLLTYFIAILQWSMSIDHQPSVSIGDGFWHELVVRQMMFFRIPQKQCASRWL